MDYVGYLLLALIAAIVLLQWRMAKKARAIEGQAAPELDPAISDKLRERGRVLLYFFSPNCGPCRSFTPRIDRAAARHDNIFKVDVSRSTDLARRLGVMATPTTVLISEGRIAQVALGVLSDERLEELMRP